MNDISHLEYEDSAEAAWLRDLFDIPDPFVKRVARIVPIEFDPDDTDP